jgi:hypothetical protein
MATTYEPIATYTVTGSAVASYTFTSIPQTYTDLILVANLRNSGTNSASYVRVGNGSIDTATNYSTTYLEGDGSTAYSGRDSNRAQVDGLRAALSTSASDTFNGNLVHFMNYSNTTTYKTILVRSGNPAVVVNASVSLWRSTSAIDQVRVYTNANTEVGSSLTLFGIKAA